MSMKLTRRPRPAAPAPRDELVAWGNHYRVTRDDDGTMVVYRHMVFRRDGVLLQKYVRQG
jgi:hypothetical protein